jgi:Putative Ig domain
MRSARIVHTFLGLALCAATLTAQSSINIGNTNFPPATVGQPYNVAIQVSGGLAPYVWSSSGQLPPGITLTTTGVLIGTPTSGGTFNFTVIVVDARQASASRAVVLSVLGTGARLAVTTAALPAGTVGQSYSQALTATGGTPPYSWAVGQGFPSGFTFDATTGTIAGTPTSAGSYSFPVQVTDSAKTSATGTVTLTINVPPLAITTVAPIFNGTVGVAYVQTFKASGGAPPYTWSILSGSAGNLTLDPASGNLQGTPQNAGTFNFTVQVSDASAATATQTFSLVVNPPALTISVGGTLPSGTVNAPYSQILPVVATGGTPPYTWSLISGTPPGLTLASSTLTLSGTPTTAGTFNFTVQAADSAGLTASRSLSLLINTTALFFTTGRQFPDGTLNQPYSQLVAASGGQPPYRWSATGLPAGLTIDSTSGQISGTPTAAGDFGIAITVSDSALSNLSDRFTLSIKLPPAPGVTISGLPNSIGPAQQFPIQIAISSPFPAPINGQAILTFAPDTGPADRTIQFASGGTTANFTIAAGSTTPDVSLAVQSGTVSGTLSISLRLLAGGIDITPSPAPIVTSQVARAAPVIRGVQVNRSGSTINIVVTGFSTAREVTQAVFNFNAASGQSLQASASMITVDVNTLFGNWFLDPNNGQFGSVFILTQPFTVQGDANSVIPSKVTLTNRLGSASFDIPQ